MKVIIIKFFQWFKWTLKRINRAVIASENSNWLWKMNIEAIFLSLLLSYVGAEDTATEQLFKDTKIVPDVLDEAPQENLKVRWASFLANQMFLLIKKICYIAVDWIPRRHYNRWRRGIHSNTNLWRTKTGLAIRRFQPALYNLHGQSRFTIAYKSQMGWIYTLAGGECTRQWY